MNTEQVAKIARLNDRCRTALGLAGKLVQTEGICALSFATQSAIRERGETFDAFGQDNDRYGERDFGCFDLDCCTIFLKIDYYNRSLNADSEDPSDRARTTRVLTIMLASE